MKEAEQTFTGEKISAAPAAGTDGGETDQTRRQRAEKISAAKTPEALRRKNNYATNLNFLLLFFAS